MAIVSVSHMPEKTVDTICISELEKEIGIKDIWFSTFAIVNSPVFRYKVFALGYEDGIGWTLEEACESFKHWNS